MAKNLETFSMYIATLKVLKLIIYFFRTRLLAILQQNKALTKIQSKYADDTDIFFSNLVIELSENISINKYAIELIKTKQSLYTFIYSLNLKELKTLEAYIKTHLKMRFL